MTNKLSMPYLSASRISLFETCSQSFFLNYVDKVDNTDDTKDFYANYGTLFHDIAEQIGKGNYSLDLAFQHYDRKFMSCGLPDDIRPEYYKLGKKGIEDTYNELQELDIVGIEESFKFSLDFTMPPLHGFIDLIYRDEQGRLVVRDYKTSKTYGKTQMDSAYQPEIYALACKHLYGEYPIVFEFDFPRFGTKRQILIDDAFIEMAELKLKGVWKRMQQSHWEATYNPFFCESFCGKKSICSLYLQKTGEI